jgi:hypothetical protein
MLAMGVIGLIVFIISYQCPFLSLHLKQSLKIDMKYLGRRNKDKAQEFKPQMML